MLQLFLKASAKGSAVVRVGGKDLYAIWIGVNHVTLMISKEDVAALKAL